MVKKLHRRGFTLLEMILALAILAGAMAAISELVRIGGAKARDSVDLTRAELICDSLLSEIVAGIRTPDPVFMQSYEGEVDDQGQAVWLYSVESENTPEQGMLSVRVTVARNDATGGDGGLECSLVRWMIDPNTLASLSSATTGGQP